ncbi:glycoside hydrolase family 16 protein [Salegentibacter sediminis]|uniref:glycoside hydrolase family 16 protein n=1 Tax=Salegentibacter sediminis TaxID=1930251 RepID=UPI0009BF0CF5|nr:glycoside hydrolase family 16 protein [Salegentibacter sediminis]
MKNIINTGLVALSLVFASACSNDDYDIGEISAPTDLQVETTVVGQSEDMPEGDGSGQVIFNASAEGAMTYKYVFENGSTETTASGEYTHQFSETGTKTYMVTVIAYGPGGTATSTIVDVEVLVTYSPPADLLEKLVGDGAKEWRIKAEAAGHFGLGPVGGNIPTEWYGAGPNEKAGVGMYDDRYIFEEDGTFVHITNATNDDENVDPSGTVFGRAPLVDQLGVSCDCETEGADVLNIPYDDYTENWSISAPGGKETINLTGLGFIGYYIGGDHRYEIFDRSGTDELILRSTDGNGEFDWWFILTSGDGAEEEPEEEFQSEYDELLWEADFDTDGDLDTSIWNFETGNNDGWGNQEAQYYTEDNAVISGGNLVITAKAEDIEGFDYSSSRITTKDNFEFTYGRVEARAKLPEGAGTWPAIWMLGSDFDEVGWPQTGEIDIMEHAGNEQDLIHGTLHYEGRSGGDADGNTIMVDGVSDEFHTYTMEWSDKRIVFLVDGEVYHTYENTPDSPFNKDFFLILNVAMGGTFGGDIDPDFAESSMEVDYIRVFQ